MKAQIAPHDTLSRMSTIFNSTETTDGYTWTIASRLGDALRDAESLFGERDKSYTILGVELTNQGYPQIWYPGDRKHLIVQVTESCLFDMDRAIFQVAHDAIHCLAPNGSAQANVLEEGLATLYAERYYSCIEGHGYLKSAVPSYIAARDLVLKLLSYDADIIKKVRNVEPNFSSMNPEQFHEIESVSKKLSSSKF